jgi:hypothetical protein
MPAETTGRTPTYSAGSGSCSRSTPEVPPRGPTGRVSSMPGRARSFASKPRAGRYQHQEHVDTLHNRWSSGNVKRCERSALHSWAEKFSSPAPTGAGSCRKNVRSREDPKRRTPIRDVFARVADHAINKSDELLPWNREADGLTPIRRLNKDWTLIALLPVQKLQF